MKLALVNTNWGKVTNENLKQLIESVVGSENQDVVDTIYKLFKDYIQNVVVSELAEILKIMYDGDSKRLGIDIVAAKLAGAERNEKYNGIIR